MTTPALPPLYAAQQRFERTRPIEDLGAEVCRQLEALALGRQIKAGQSVALAVGSRGIRGIAEIAAAVVAHLKALGARPFIFPAMGSHGGGTVAGQRGVLANLGVTEERVGCEVRATMEVVELDRARFADGTSAPVLLDAIAAAADHIGLINRVKPHTRFAGEVESGLLKMCLIGVGKGEGARIYHQAAERQGWEPVVRAVTERLLARAPMRFGLAIVQNAYEEIAELRGLAAERFWEEEPALLVRARSLLGRLPTREVDLLVVDEMGKEISGAGMDSNIIGRKPGSDVVRVRHVFVRALTAQTRGNALGIGLADFTTRRLVDAIDFPALYLNSRTAYRTDTCKVPMTFDTDREALAAALPMAAREALAAHRLIWIRNTLELERIIVSAALLPELAGRPGLTVASEPLPAGDLFDQGGNLVRPPGL